MNTLLQTLVSGVALGSSYALVALGFSVVFRSSGVINFGQGAMVMIGAYIISWTSFALGLPFWLALLIAIAVVAVSGVLFDAGVLRRVPAKEINSSVIITLMLSVGLVALIEIIFGTEQRQLGDNWGTETVGILGAVLPVSRVWGIVTALLLFAAFAAIDRYTRFGLAMRASASDEEAALAVGVPIWKIRSMTWGIAGLLAVVAGIFLSSYPSTLTPTLWTAALAAFPALILGGLNSPSGALIGGLIIGIVQMAAGTYQQPWMGNNFDSIAPFIVMIVILLVRPYGLMGGRPAERI